MNNPDTPADRNQTGQAFQELLEEIRRDESLLEQLDDAETREGPAPDDQTEVPASTELLPVSDAAIDLIITFEVSSRETYQRKYRQPIWPKGRSGVTIGIGYDVGYVDAAALRRDWSAYLPAAELATLSQACGVTGAAAAALLPQLRHIDISYDSAHAVFVDVSLVRYTSLTVRALPNAAALHPDSLGALVSLVYNRGASFEAAGDRYAEMRQIRADMAAQHFADIPAQIRKMKRIWIGEPHSAGLVKRRELEARLFEHGLAAT